MKERKGPTRSAEISTINYKKIEFMNIERQKTTLPTQTFTPLAIHKDLEAIWSEYKTQFPSFNDFCRTHLYIVTARYEATRLTIRHGNNVITLSNGRTRTRKHPLDWFGSVYFEIVKHVIGNNFCRKSKMRLQPRCYGFVDFAGSRAVGKIDIASAKDLHVHAVLLVRPEHLARFLDVRQRLQDQPYSVRATKVMIERFDSFEFQRRLIDEQANHSSRTASTPFKAIAYAMKGYLKFDMSFADREDLAAIYPWPHVRKDNRPKPQKHNRPHAVANRRKRKARRTHNNRRAFSENMSYFTRREVYHINQRYVQQQRRSNRTSATPHPADSPTSNCF